MVLFSVHDLNAFLSFCPLKDRKTSGIFFAAQMFNMLNSCDTWSFDRWLLRNFGHVTPYRRLICSTRSWLRRSEIRTTQSPPVLCRRKFDQTSAAAIGDGADRLTLWTPERWCHPSPSWPFIPTQDCFSHCVNDHFLSCDRHARTASMRGDAITPAFISKTTSHFRRA
jgi:hypothetical protein